VVRHRYCFSNHGSTCQPGIVNRPWPHFHGLLALLNVIQVFMIRSVSVLSCYLGSPYLVRTSVDYDNEVKVRWHMTGWLVPTMIHVWTKFSEPWLNDLFMKHWSILKKSVDYENEVSQEIHDWPFLYPPWSMYGPNMESLDSMTIQKLT
jgi:hypothetical protein